MKKSTAIVLGAGSAVAAGAAARTTQRTWSALQAPADVASFPDTFEREWIDGPNGHSLHLVRSGTGPITCVFAHGVMLEARSWIHQLAALPDLGIGAVAYDHRGHGASTRPDQEYTIEAMADDLASVVESVDGDVVIVGHSMGGIVAQAFALHHPKLLDARVRGLGLVATLSRTPHFMHRGPGRQFGRLLFGTIPDRDRVFVHQQLGRLASRIPFGQRPRAEDVELVREMIAECELDNWRSALQSLVGFDFGDRLHEITVPTTVFAGTRDTITPIWENRRIARLIPDAQLLEYKGCGHMIMLERRAEFEADLVAFVRAVQNQ